MLSRKSRHFSADPVLQTSQGLLLFINKITSCCFSNQTFLPWQLTTKYLIQACSLSALHSCSLTSDGRVLNRSSSTTRPLLFNSRHSPSSTGRHSKRFPLSSSWVNPVSSPKRDGSVCRQLFPRLSVRSFLHWKSSGGKVSI